MQIRRPDRYIPRAARVTRSDRSWNGESVFTIDQLFDDADFGVPTSAVYDSVLGYPTRMEIGTIANDAGVLYYVTELRPIVLK